MIASARPVLLDLDGTLVDSLPGIRGSCVAALRALGHAAGPDLDMAGLIGPPIDEIMRVLLARHGDDRVAAGVAAYRADYGRLGLFGSRTYPGIPAALAALRDAGARLYLATSKRRVFAERILAHLDLAGFFAGIHGSEEGGALDEKPALLAFIAARHGLAAAECVMVGDRRHDVAGARANGMRSLGVLWGYGDRDELESAGVEAVIAGPSELPAAALAENTGAPT